MLKVTIEYGVCGEARKKTITVPDNFNALNSDETVRLIESKVNRSIEWANIGKIKKIPKKSLTRKRK